MFYIKPYLKNMSHGARLEYIREVIHANKEDVTSYFGFGGKEPNKTIREYEGNSTSLSKERLEELAKLYEVSIDAIRKWDFTNPIDEIYYQMWSEEEFPYYQFNIEMDSFLGKYYKMNVYNGIQEWNKMRERRKNYDISDDEYLEWKLNFKIKNKIRNKWSKQERWLFNRREFKNI